jgi:hypothetical protein
MTAFVDGGRRRSGSFATATDDIPTIRRGQFGVLPTSFVLHQRIHDCVPERRLAAGVCRPNEWDDSRQRPDDGHHGRRTTPRQAHEATCTRHESEAQVRQHLVCGKRDRHAEIVCRDEIRDVCAFRSSLAA